MAVVLACGNCVGMWRKLVRQPPISVVVPLSESHDKSCWILRNQKLARIAATTATLLGGPPLQGFSETTARVPQTSKPTDPRCREGGRSELPEHAIHSTLPHHCVGLHKTRSKSELCNPGGLRPTSVPELGLTILNPDACMCRTRCTSKTRHFEQVSKMLSRCAKSLSPCCNLAFAAVPS